MRIFIHTRPKKPENMPGNSCAVLHFRYLQKVFKGEKHLALKMKRDAWTIDMWGKGQERERELTKEEKRRQGKLG